jgi:hypothetical protein
MNARTDAYTQVVLWMATQTDLAVKVSPFPRHDTNRRLFWLPKSQIEIVRNEPAIPPQWDRIVVNVPDWLCNKHDL